MEPLLPKDSKDTSDPEGQKKAKASHATAIASKFAKRLQSSASANKDKIQNMVMRGASAELAEALCTAYDGKTNKLFKLDQDVLTRQNLQKLLPLLMVSPVQDMNGYFDRACANQDGRLTPEELIKLLELLRKDDVREDGGKGAVKSIFTKVVKDKVLEMRARGQRVMEPFAMDSPTTTSGDDPTTSGHHDHHDEHAGHGAHARGDIKKDFGERWWLWLIFFIICLTLLGVTMVMTRTALFHCKSIGRYDNGHPYNFSYTWPLTLLNFGVMSTAGVSKFVSKRVKKKRDGIKPLFRGDALTKLQGKVEDKQASASINPWRKYGFVLVQAVLEIISQWCTSWALVCGVPATLAVVFRNAGCIMMGICSKILNKIWPDMPGTKGAPDTLEQWISFIVIWVGLLIAAAAEGRGGRRRAGNASPEAILIGIGLMLLGEFIRTLVLILQAIQLGQTAELKDKDNNVVSDLPYWKDPVDLGTAAALVGFVQTAVIMYFMRDVTIPTPEGGRRPQNSLVDMFVMCLGCPALLVLLFGHIVTQIGSELGHMYILRYMTAVGRSICDVLKIPTMWLIGKLFWRTGMFPPLAEPWKPGLIGSWLMFPAILVISYGMLMFKEKSFCPHRSMYDSDRDKNEYEIAQGPAALDVASQAALYNAGAQIQKQSINSKRLVSLKAGTDVESTRVAGLPSIEE